MVAKRDIDAEDTIHQTRVNLAVRIKRRQSGSFDTFLQIYGECSEHRKVNFVAIHIFKEPFFVQILFGVVLVFGYLVGNYKVSKVFVGDVLLPTNILSL